MEGDGGVWNANCAKQREKRESGDVQRVKGTAGGVTTAYVGSYFEWTGSVSTMKRYYAAGGSRVAVRTGASTLNFLLSDHLGGTAVTTDLSGVRTSEVRYMPWGSDRYSYGTTPTSDRFDCRRIAERNGKFLTKWSR